MMVLLGQAAAALLGFGGRAVRDVNWQGWFGLAAIAVLGVLLVIQKGETRHWTKLAHNYETLYNAEKTAHAKDVVEWEAKSLTALRLDAENAARVVNEQNTITSKRWKEYDARIAAARARADSLRQQLDQASHNPSGAGATPVPDLSPAAGGTPHGPDPDGLSLDERLTATEQAIQLDELIKWVKGQHTVDVNGR